MNDPLLRADCARCAALCCVALAFDKSESFAFAKPAGTPCRHLTPDHRCAVHASRSAQGLSGCVRYDCLGAGQRVTQEVFHGRSWRENSALAPLMCEAFAVMREIHALLELLQTARCLPLTSEQRALLERHHNALCPTPHWTLESLKVFARGTLAKDIRAFLRGLKDAAAAPGAVSLSALRTERPPQSPRRTLRQF